MTGKIALVHDYIKEYGGAERVLEALHEIYPQAPVFTLVYCPQFLGPHRKRFASWDIRPSFLQIIPFKEKLISPFRLIAPFIFRLFDFHGYDIIIVSAAGAYTPNCIQKRNAKHICYCHTPPRYLYGYATAREWKKHLIIRIFGEIANHFLRIIDSESAQNVDLFIANSYNVAHRIKKFYRRDATVIYPPVDSPKHSGLIRKQEYYLAGGRLARPKHIDILVKAANALQIPLKIFGRSFAGYGEELRLLAGPTVEFLGEISDAEKTELMGNAKAFLFAGEDEDFGITPVESMGMGTPVIAYRSGGVIESVVDKKTGLFFDTLRVQAVIAAIKRFERLAIKKSDCQKQAKMFGKKIFVTKMREILVKMEKK